MGRKKVSIEYFGDVEEAAVLKYNHSLDKDEKNEIFESVLKVPFQRMIESILRKYPIYIGNYEMREVEMNAISHLLENMVKYNPNKILKNGNKPKAFSYCQTIVRNYYKLWGRVNYNLTKTNLHFDDYTKDVYNNENNIFEMDLDIDGNRRETPYVGLFENIIDGIEWRLEHDQNLRNNDILIGNELVSIFKNWEILFLEESPESNIDVEITGKYLKNKIYLILRENTGLQLKDIRTSLKIFKDVYIFEKKCLNEDK